jgi:hypothetical protein
MRFLCLAYYDPARFDALPQAERDALVRECKALDAQLVATGAVVLQGSLAPPTDTRCLRPARAGPLVTDGPYTETKEQVGGFFMLEAPDLAAAVAIASKHPAAIVGGHVGMGIEVRPIGDYCPDPDRA